MADPSDREDKKQARPVDRALLERWALAYLGRHASSVENLRRVLRRRLRRETQGDADAALGAETLIDALLARYRKSGLLDDRAYAASRVRSRHRRGASLQMLTADLAALGVDSEDRSVAIEELKAELPEPNLTAAGVFARRRRLGPYRRETSSRDPADLDRERAAFSRAGFGRRETDAVLACVDIDAVEALMRDGID